VYRPSHFDVADAVDLHDVLDAGGPAHLVTHGPDGLDASVVPMVLDRSDGPLGTLRGHLARPNPQWKALDGTSRALAIVMGPDGYVSPSWYVSKARSGRVVPTWNYVVVHAHGDLVVRDDAEWLAAQVRALTDRHEADRAEPWSVDDAPAEYVEAMLLGIVGLELRITRLEGKRKLSQNRPEDRAGVIAALEREGAGPSPLAEAMRAEMTRGQEGGR
jgi:transcriptional regulator